MFSNGCLVLPFPSYFLPDGQKVERELGILNTPVPKESVPKARREGLKRLASSLASRLADDQEGLSGPNPGVQILVHK